MRLPYLQGSLPESKMQTIEFKGYNANPVTDDGEMSGCRNLTSDNYPVLAPRLPRRVVRDDLVSPTAMYVREGKIAYVDGDKFYFDGKAKGVVAAGEKQFVSMGDRIIIFPDKCIYDISDDNFESLEINETYVRVTFEANKIKQNVDASNPGKVFRFKAGDGVIVSGDTKTNNNGTYVIKSVSDYELTFNDNTFVATSSRPNLAEMPVITIKRQIPDLEYVCEYNNRLWGTCGNTIYASALGKPENFNVFRNLASDSYSIEVGSSGAFTGCIGFGTHVAFFKEHCIHRIYGSKPSNFQFADAQSQGVRLGAHKSLVNVSDNIIYLSLSGIMDYTGGTPDVFSQNFGTRRFSQAVAGTDGSKYYVSLKEGDLWELFVYDFSKGIWLKEDDTHAIDFSYDNGVLYMLSSDKKIYAMKSDDLSNELVDWYAEFGEMTESADEKKIHRKFNLQFELLEPRASVGVYINENRKGWKEVYRTAFNGRKMVSIPIVPTRCDFINIKVKGKGQAKIYSLSKSVMMGSDEN